MKKCCKCKDGYIEMYRHVKNGICFECDGLGYIFDTEKEKEEYLEMLEELKSNYYYEFGDEDEEYEEDEEYWEY